MRLNIVFDSNVYVAAALRPGAYCDMWLDIATLPGSGFRPFVSQAILDEVRDWLVELELPPEGVARFSRRIEGIATVVVPSERVRAVRDDDPDDNAILECALAAQAQLIVSADHHLLKLSPYRVAHPRELKHIFASDFEQAA